MKWLIGPFRRHEVMGDYIAFDDVLFFEKKTVLKIFEKRDKKTRLSEYYAVVEGDDEMQYYMSVLPENCKEISEISVPVCTYCGSASIDIDEDPDEGVLVWCERCRRTSTKYKQLVLWKGVEVDLKDVKMGRGPYEILRKHEYERPRLSLIKEIGEGKEMIEDVEVSYCDFYGVEELEDGSDRYVVVRVYNLGKIGVRVVLREASQEEVEKVRANQVQLDPEVVKKIEAELKKIEEEEKIREEKKTPVQVKTWKDMAVEEVKKMFQDLPVSVKVDESLLLGEEIVVKLEKYVDSEKFKRYVETCKRLGLRYDSSTKTWKGPARQFIPVAE